MDGLLPYCYKIWKKIGINIFLILNCYLFLFGCTRSISPSQDESLIRREFFIPDEVKMVSIWRSSDRPGTFGREGLRIVAEFQLNTQQKEDFLKKAQGYGWKRLPKPNNINSFRYPPEELPKNVKEGMYFCYVHISGKWIAGKKQEEKKIACEDIKENFDSYRIGLFDIETGKINIVFQNYY
jgi:methionine salvage enolase-phosphatase E1